jgi:hypothetical protein
MATTTFNDLITFSRGSNATVTGPNGLIQWAPSNLLTNSQDFEAAAWGKSASGQVTVTANQAIAPDGSRTADLTVPNASSGYHSIRQGPTTSANVHAQSVYYKPSGYTKVAIREDFAVGQYASFDCTGAGTIIDKTAAASASITLLADGWYRITLTPTTTSANQGMGVYIMNAGYASGDPAAYTFTGDGTSGGFLWGAQLELGSTATAYNNTSVRNLLGFSEAFNNAAWNKISSSMVISAQANPVNGLFNAQKLMEDTAASGHQVTQSATTTANPFTFSSYIKAAERNWAVLAITDSGSVVRRGFFNLATGTVGTTDAGITASITSVGNGWYRCSITIAASLAGNTVCRIYLSNDGVNVSYTGDGNSGVYIYGAQLSNSASLDPYVPTPGAAPSSTAYYGPRFDYDPVTLLPRGLLIEEARTNLLLQSETFSTTWANFGFSLDKNYTSPSGQNTATKIVPDNATTLANNALQQDVSKAASAITYTCSIFAKAGEFNRLRLLVRDTASGSNFARATFNLGTKTVSDGPTVGGTFSAASVSYQDASEGFIRYCLTFTTGTEVSIRPVLVVFDAVATTGNGTSGIYAYGAQLEAGAFATSYIPTIASTVTRSADVATITGSLFSQWYNQPAGTLVADIQKLSPSTVATYGYELLGATSSFSMRVRVGTDGRMQSVDGGVTQVDTQIQASALSTPSKYAMAYAANDYAGSANGGAVGTDTSATVPAISSLALGSAAVSNLYIRSIRYVPVRAADFQLQQVTT